MISRSFKRSFAGRSFPAFAQMILVGCLCAMSAFGQAEPKPAKLTSEQSKDVQIVQLRSRVASLEAALAAAHKETEELRQQGVFAQICAANKIDPDKCVIDAQSQTVSERPKIQPPGKLP